MLTGSNLETEKMTCWTRGYQWKFVKEWENFYILLRSNSLPYHTIRILVCFHTRYYKDKAYYYQKVGEWMKQT